MKPKPKPPTSVLLSVFLLPLLAIGAAHASSQTLALDLYQTPDGAITVNEHGDFVDPYFANRALTLADENGMDVRVIAGRWIPWLMARQLSDGRFERYCKSDGSDWSPCKPADADDAGLAVWLELLYRTAPASGLPAAWQASATRATRYLEGLRDPISGLHFVSHDVRVCLLMDNVEVYHLFRMMAEANRRFGRRKLGRSYDARAIRLADAIWRRLWSPREANFQASTQEHAPATFYPADVAQVYPWLFDMPTPVRDSKAAFRNWLSSYEEIWLGRHEDRFPWGIIALAGQRLGETVCVARWIENSKSLRHSAYWTVLDEAVVQILTKDSH